MVWVCTLWRYDVPCEVCSWRDDMVTSLFTNHTQGHWKAHLHIGIVDKI